MLTVITARTMERLGDAVSAVQGQSRSYWKANEVETLKKGRPRLRWIDDAELYFSNMGVTIWRRALNGPQYHLSRVKPKLNFFGCSEEEEEEGCNLCWINTYILYNFIYSGVRNLCQLQLCSAVTISALHCTAPL